MQKVWTIGLALGLVTGVASQVAAQDEPPRERRREEQKPKDVKLKLRLDQKLKFMAGCWEGTMGKDQIVEEIWTNPSENLMTSTTRYLNKGRAVSYEFSRIVSTDTSVTFSASTEGKAFDSYEMVQQVDDYVVFENKAKSFPQRIIYRKAADGSLIPRNEGEGQTSVEVRLSKVKCPGT